MNHHHCTPGPKGKELATTIATHLNAMTDSSRWTVEGDLDADGERRPDAATLLRDSDGASIHLRIGGWRQEGRVTFRAGWPRFHDGGQYVPRAYLTITCSASRDPRALAGDIARRLLSEYDPAYRDALAYVRARDAAARETIAVAERIAQAVGAELPASESYRRQRSGDAVNVLAGPSNVHRLRVVPPYEDRPVSVSFEVNGVDEQTALRVFELLAEKSAEAGR